jgi:hypothetical protein
MVQWFEAQNYGRGPSTRAPRDGHEFIASQQKSYQAARICFAGAKNFRGEFACRRIFVHHNCGSAVSHHKSARRTHRR